MRFLTYFTFVDVTAQVRSCTYGVWVAQSSVNTTNWYLLHTLLSCEYVLVVPADLISEAWKVLTQGDAPALLTEPMSYCLTINSLERPLFFFFFPITRFFRTAINYLLHSDHLSSSHHT